MSRTARYFEIIQILRAADRPILAAELAEALEVSVRTIYRDIAYLQARNTPIHGETGIGYVMRRGYDLPAVRFNEDEAEAVYLGLSMIARTGDRGLWKSAKSAARKLHAVAPGVRHLITTAWGATSSDVVDTSHVRHALRDERKLDIAYKDVNGRVTTRTVWPIALIYYADSEVCVGWCELRQAVRHFRIDRILSLTQLEDRFTGAAASILSEWEETQKHASVDARPIHLAD
ncbi:MAG: YafY family protein [Pseudomonadota bacterium]